MQELGADTVDVMRGIKRALDPFWLMNPGKIFSATRSEAPDETPQTIAASSMTKPRSEGLVKRHG